MPAFNEWYHVNGNTYGTWLRGDARGWRDKKHREHVEGDYRNPPPPGTYDALRDHVRAHMKGKPVRLSTPQRQLVGQAMVKRLVEDGVELLAFSMDATHFHVLARFGPQPARRLIGNARRHAYHLLAAAGRKGRLWARGCRVLPVRDRKHQVNVYRYILAHRDQDAWVWDYKQGVYWK